MDVDPEGDVVLIRQASTPNEVRFRVSSYTLKTASKMFRALLKPDFSKCNILAQPGCVEITLSGDDGECMLLIGNFIHMHHGDHSFCGDPIVFYMTCDKYDAVPVLAPWIYIWLEKALESCEKPSTAEDFQRLHKMCTVAVAFDHSNSPTTSRDSGSSTYSRYSKAIAP